MCSYAKEPVTQFGCMPFTRERTIDVLNQSERCAATQLYVAFYIQVAGAST